MAQPGTPSWVFDYAQHKYYYYDVQNDQLVYQDGQRSPRPSHIPRTTFLSVAASSIPTQAQPESPPHVAYIHRAGRPTDQGSGRQAVSPNFAPRSPESIQGRQRVDSGNQSQDLATALGGLAVGTPASPSALQGYDPRPVQARVYETNGMRFVSAVDRRNGVRMTMATGPAKRVTDPTLFDAGVRAHRMLVGHGAQQEEQLFSTFRMREQPQRFFIVGRVFLVLWTEPAGETATLITSREPNDRPARVDPGMTVGRFGERVYSKVRRFVVVRAGEKYCSALPVASYGGQGVGKSGVTKSEHAIIYTGAQAPEPLAKESPGRGEQPMRARPIRVVPDEPTGKLDGTSRIDFGKVHSIQHNIKVKPFGNVHPHSMDALLTQFANVWGHTPTTVASSSRDRTDAGSSSDDDDDEEQLSTRVAHERHLSPGAVNLEEQQARRVVASYSNLLQQGRTRQQAFDYLIHQVMASNPSYTRETADTLLRARLAYGSQARPQATGGAGSGHSKQDSEEDGSADEEDADEDNEDADDDDEDADEDGDDDGEDDENAEDIRDPRRRGRRG
ncbi:hypothetical protein LTR85_002331 [Meristemomyces frigidus]|nr:hypothetical protein LTR85_002331 [Meristemomyces frigidus]